MEKSLPSARAKDGFSESEVMKMKCKRVQKLLTAFVDGELAPPRAASVSEHLAMCDVCREQAAEVKKVLAWAGTWRDREPSPGFVTRLRARIRSEREAIGLSRKVWIPRARLAFAGVAAASVIFVGGYLVGALFSGRAAVPRGAPLARGAAVVAPKSVTAYPVADSRRLIAGLQRIKMSLGSKLSDASFNELNEVQRALAAGGDSSVNDLAILEELQRAEGLIRQKKFALARGVLDGIETSHPGHPLVEYAQMTKMLASPQAVPGWGLLKSSYAMLLQDTLVNPAEFYNDITSLPAQITEYGWQSIVKSADKLNPLNLFDYIESRILGRSETL